MNTNMTWFRLVNENPCILVCWMKVALAMPFCSGLQNLRVSLGLVKCQGYGLVTLYIASIPLQLVEIMCIVKTHYLHKRKISIINHNAIRILLGLMVCRNKVYFHEK